MKTYPIKSTNQTDVIYLSRTCCMCGKDALGENYTNFQFYSELHNRVIAEKLTKSVYTEPRGKRLHHACYEKLKTYFQIQDRKHAHTTLTLKK